MSNEVYGVLLDTASIQRYIFSTNNLRENIGASHAVEDIYEGHLKEVIKELFHLSDDKFFDAWKDNPDKIAIKEEPISFEIGYIGGGNAFLLFKDEGMAKRFIQKWSMRLLVHCPGIIPACAIGVIDFNKFSDDLDGLFRILAENKSSFVPETIIRRHGITAECPRTGYSADVWCEGLPDEEKGYISSVSNAKIMASKEANRKLQGILEETGLDSEYIFTDQLDKLGQSKGEDSHIAIVHIDGNDMGKRVSSQKDLKSLREFSKTLRDATLQTFKAILKEIDKNIGAIDEGIELEKSGEKTILPLRPIIIGGDDITFVSEGRLGIWLSKIFLEEFERQKISDGEPISACAGVAITKTKYPFYRGYQLSEDLTRSAKDARKIANDNGSWIDFHLAYGGFSGGLKEIRESHYRTPEVISLLLRPYKITDLDELLEGVAKLKKKKDGKDKFPRSKIMELRSVIYSDESERNLFMEKLKARGLRLPEYKDFKGEEGKEIIKNNKTPYFDMIEIMDLYPKFALSGGKDEDL